MPKKDLHNLIPQRQHLNTNNSINWFCSPSKIKYHSYTSYLSDSQDGAFHARRAGGRLRINVNYSPPSEALVV